MSLENLCMCQQAGCELHVKYVRVCGYLVQILAHILITFAIHLVMAQNASKT